MNSEFDTKMSFDEATGRFEVAFSFPQGKEDAFQKLITMPIMGMVPTILQNIAAGNIPAHQDIPPGITIVRT